jgi:hypothetical protein
VDYAFDVFISYKRHRYQNRWLTKHFLGAFEFFLEQEVQARLARPPSVFFDQSKVRPEILAGALQNGGGIEPGTRWQEELERAIKTSRCMVGLWSPTYFGSRWCRREWRSFAGRPKLPLVPASVYDGNDFPPEARAIERIDLSTFVLQGIDRTDRFADFEERVRLLAESVAEKVQTAPPFQDWIVADPGPDPVGRLLVLPSLADAPQ